MDEPRHGHDAGDDPLPGGTEFDDPTLEAAFGLAEPGEWIERARRSEAPRPPLGRLGPYELLEEIGHGGQGVVYKAVQPGTGRFVAIKRIAAGQALGTRARARFAQEVQALARLRHPSIVTVHGAEDLAGLPTLVMEYVAGQPIDRWADGPDPGGGRRAPAMVLEVFALVCDAVAHAHQRGVIHRDLKPSNVLVDDGGVPRVLDFGIARLVGDLQTGASDGLTMTSFAGTPGYASPEQLEGSADADTRTDVYSLGALLYRLLTGVEPFSRELSLPALIVAVREGALPRPSRACPSMPGECDWVVLKAMSRDPAQRYPSVEALAADVRRFLNGEPVIAHPPSGVYAAAKFVRRHRLACTATGAGLLMILGLAGVSVAQAVRVSSQNRTLVLAIESETRARKAADAERARADAQTAAHRDTARAIGEAVAAIASRAGRTPSMTSAQVLAFIESETGKLPEPEDPLSRVQFHSLRAQLAGSARRSQESADHWLRAVAVGEGAYAAGDAPLSLLRRRCAQSLVAVGRYDAALHHATRAVETTDRKERFGAMHTLCGVQVNMGDLPGAEETAAQMITLAGADHADLWYALDVAASVDLARGSDARARARLERGLAELQAAGRGASRDAALTRVRIAGILLREGKAEEAEALAGAAATYRVARDGLMYIRTQDALLLHAESLSRLGCFAEAAERLEQALPRCEAAYGRGSRRVAGHRVKLAAAYLGAGTRMEGRRNLALALSRGASNDPEWPSLCADVQRCESAIMANGWQVDRALAELLGPRAWLVEDSAEVPASAPEAGRDDPDSVPPSP